MRELFAAIVTFCAGVVAATAGAGVAVRVGGVYLVLDAVVLAASWRLTAGGLKIPTLASRRREIAGGSELVVSPSGGWFGSIDVTGSQGTRTLRVNPLVSPTDLRAWFAEIADEPPAS